MPASDLTSALARANHVKLGVDTERQYVFDHAGEGTWRLCERWSHNLREKSSQRHFLVGIIPCSAGAAASIPAPRPIVSARQHGLSDIVAPEAGMRVGPALQLPV